MTLPATVDRLEELPEELRPHYVATEDGRFRLDADGVEDVAGLKSALEKERAARRALKAELAAREDASAEAAGSDEAGTDEADPADGETEPAMHDAETPESRLDALETRLIEAEARGAVEAARGVPELLLPILRGLLAVRDDGAGGLAVRVLDAAGEPRRRGEGEDGFMTVADLVEGLRADPVYGRAFDGSGRGGSGAPTAGRGEGGPLTIAADDPRALSRHLADIAAGRVRVA